VEHIVEERDGIQVVRPEGPLDVASALSLRETLGALVSVAGARVLLDLAGVTLIDSSGVGILVTAHRQAESAGARFALAAPRTTVGRVFELTRTNKLLDIHPTVDEGIAALA
jgi:anti-sigma B factor antagonist